MEQQPPKKKLRKKNKRKPKNPAQNKRFFLHPPKWLIPKSWKKTKTLQAISFSNHKWCVFDMSPVALVHTTPPHPPPTSHPQPGKKKKRSRVAHPLKCPVHLSPISTSWCSYLGVEWTSQKSQSRWSHVVVVDFWGGTKFWIKKTDGERVDFVVQGPSFLFWIKQASNQPNEISIKYNQIKYIQKNKIKNCRSKIKYNPIKYNQINKSINNSN